jgi:ABC-type sugar transport system substrate-binding protein
LSQAKEQGGKAIETAVKTARKQAFEKEVLIPFQLVTRENVGGVFEVTLFFPPIKQNAQIHSFKAFLCHFKLCL